jgi:UDP-glucuronate decarboxylase
VNLGNPEEFSIRQLAETVLRLTGSRASLEEAPLPEDDPIQRCPDIRLAKEKLEWCPAIKLQDGLEITIAYFKKLLFSTAPKSSG